MKTILTLLIGFLPAILSAQSWKNYTTSNSAIPTDTINSLGIGLGEKVWVGCYGLSKKNTLAYFNGSTFHAYTGINYVSDMIESYGRTWALTPGGLFDIGESDMDIKNYPVDTATGLYVLGTAKPMVRTANGYFWIKPDQEKGLLSFNPSATAVKRWEIFNKKNSSLTTDSIMHIAARYEGGDNYVYAATANKGLVKFDGSTTKSYTTANSSIPSDHLSLIELGEGKTVWMISNNLLVKFDGDSTFTSYTTTGFRYAFVMRQGPDSTLWIGTDKGLLKFRNGTFSMLDSSNTPITNNYVWALRIDKQNNIWIGTYGGGLYVYNEKGPVVLSIQTQQPTSLSLYPNPATDYVEINCSETVKSISLYDMQGKRIAAEINGNSIKLSEIAPGIYTVEVETAGSVLRQKLVKK